MTNETKKKKEMKTINETMNEISSKKAALTKAIEKVQPNTVKLGKTEYEKTFIGTTMFYAYKPGTAKEEWIPVSTVAIMLNGTIHGNEILEKAGEK